MKICKKIDAETKRTITSRTHPQMTKILTRFSENGQFLEVETKDYPTLKLELKEPKEAKEEEKVTLTVWSSTTNGVKEREEACEWFSKFLGKKVFLVRCVGETDREVNSKFTVKEFDSKQQQGEKNFFFRAIFPR